MTVTGEVDEDRGVEERRASNILLAVVVVFACAAGADVTFLAVGAGEFGAAWKSAKSSSASFNPVRKHIDT